MTPWYPELLEHVAVYAAERDLDGLESLCDAVLAGERNEDEVLSLIGCDDGLKEWCKRPTRKRTV